MYVGICKLETLVMYFENRVAAVAATCEEKHRLRLLLSERSVQILVPKIVS